MPKNVFFPPTFSNTRIVQKLFFFHKTKNKFPQKLSLILSPYCLHANPFRAEHDYTRFY